MRNHRNHRGLVIFVLGLALVLGCGKTEKPPAERQSAQQQQPSADAVVTRLQTARDAKWQMAELLERAMRGGGATSQVLYRTRLLGEEVPRILALVYPLAEAHDVSVEAEIGPEAKELPIGPLGAVLLNGLRNAVQACVRGQEPRCVELSAAVEGRRLVIRISDTGPGDVAAEARGGARTAGHGLGLDLCRQVVSELGGRLELGPGAGRRAAGGGIVG